jgi:hypothetical protein
MQSMGLAKGIGRAAIGTPSRSAMMTRQHRKVLNNFVLSGPCERIIDRQAAFPAP